MAATIIKTFAYKLYRNRTFEAAAQKALDASRFVYNCALEQRITRYRQGKAIGYVEQSRELTEARTLPEVGSCLRMIQNDALERLDFAFIAFFRRLRRGETPGFPRFKTGRQYSTFSQKIDPRHKCHLSGEALTVPGVGKVRVRLSRPIEGQIKQLRITHRPDGWYALLICEFNKPAPLPNTSKTVGVDMGLTNFATLSNGESIENPRHLRRAAKALRRSQQALSRKQRVSANRAKRRQLLTLRHFKVRRARLDFHHKVALDLVRRFDRIAVEDLQIQDLVKNNKCSKSIMDAGWGQFLAITQYKAENAGRVFKKVDPGYTSQTCSACGHQQKMPLVLRMFVCAKCSYVLGRDENAAVNIGRGAPKFKPAIAADVLRASRNRYAKRIL